MKLLLGDCLNKLYELERDSVDLVLCDPPYGTTKCRWDSIIPLDDLWSHLNRVAKERAAFVFTSAQPFTTILIKSNLKNFKYCWIWDKVTARGHLVAKKRPMAQHEEIPVFYRKAPTYNPKMSKRDKPKFSHEDSRTEIMGGEMAESHRGQYIYEKYPKTILTFSNAAARKDGHPTQKPVELMKYLVETYTNIGDVVLDFAMGSGTTGIACIQAKRDFIGIEKSKKWFEYANKRIGIELYRNDT